MTGKGRGVHVTMADGSVTVYPSPQLFLAAWTERPGEMSEDMVRIEYEDPERKVGSCMLTNEALDRMGIDSIRLKQPLEMGLTGHQGNYTANYSLPAPDPEQKEGFTISASGQTPDLAMRGVAMELRREMILERGARKAAEAEEREWPANSRYRLEDLEAMMEVYVPQNGGESTG